MKKQTDHARFSGLDALPLSLLEKIVGADARGEIQHDSEMIEYVEGLIAARKKEEKGEVLPTAQETWPKLQARLSEEEVEEQRPIPSEKRGGKNRKRIRGLVGTLAACFAVFLAVMITVQAMGVNIFGTLGTWTDSRFSFAKKESQSTPPVSTVAEESDDRLRRALELLNFPTEFQPKWIPERYEMTSLGISETVNMRGVCAIYRYPGGKYQLMIDIGQCDDEGLIYNGFFEKDDMEPELYTSNGRTFYLFTNAGTWTGAWTDMNYEINIGGVETKEEIKKIIDSMGE